MKIPQYRTNKPLSFGQEVVLPQHSFVKPVKTSFLPREVAIQWANWKDDPKFVICYTRYGFLPILKEDLDEV